MHVLLTSITDLGDSAFLGAVVLLLAIYLALTGSPRQAALLASALVLSAVSIAIAKIFAFDCGRNLAAWHIHSPSGHVAVSTSVYGTLAAIAADGKSSGRKRWIGASAFLLIASIAATRVLLGAHSIEEVAAGLAIGAAVCIVARLSMRHMAPLSFDGRIVALMLIVAVATFHNRHMPGEQWIDGIALYFKDYLRCG